MFLPQHLLPREDPPHIGSEFGLIPSTPPTARLTALGITYISLAALWTVLLLSGMTYLFLNRHTPTLRMRGLPLTFAGIIFLHLYWATVQSGYTIGPLAPEVAEYWIMGIWYPFGIALFQAGNSRFLWVAGRQGRFAAGGGEKGGEGGGKVGEKGRKGKGVLGWLRGMEYGQRMFLVVTLGMAVQLFVVVLVFLISRKFHPSFGIPGTEVYGKTPMEIAIQQGRGWEWWPSLFWQFLWAWVFAPIILWRSRGIKDTHGWQLQTIACCIAGLPAAPMWLVALYVPAMAPVNAVFIPPQWIALSIFVMEIFTIFVPCWQVRKHQTLRQETLDCIASWESKNKFDSGGASSNSASTSNTNTNTAPDTPLSPTSTKLDTKSTKSATDPWKTGKLPSIDLSPSQVEKGEGHNASSEKGDSPLLTMAALEHVLTQNPTPLLHFSATRDFSGENIAFLTAVAAWKSSLPAPFVRNRHNTSPEIVREVYTAALKIYTDFVGVRDAEFPINIAWVDLRKLQGVFERAARSLDGAGQGEGRRDSALLFGEVDFSGYKGEGNGSEVGIVTGSRKGSVASTETLVLQEVGLGIEGEVFGGDIPATFDESVFDAAQASIKYLVLTNTWPKYVRERRSSEGSVRTAETDETARSKGSFRRAMAFLGPYVRRSSNSV